MQSRNELPTSDSVQRLGDTSCRRMDKPTLALVVALAIMSLPARVLAQHTQLDLNGNLAIGTTSHHKSWGAGRAGRSR